VRKLKWFPLESLRRMPALSRSSEGTAKFGEKKMRSMAKAYAMDQAVALRCDCLSRAMIDESVNYTAFANSIL